LTSAIDVSQMLACMSRHQSYIVTGKMPLYLKIWIRTEKTQMTKLSKVVVTDTTAVSLVFHKRRSIYFQSAFVLRI